MRRLKVWTVAIGVFVTVLLAAKLLLGAVEWPERAEGGVFLTAFAAGLAGSYAAGCRLDRTRPELDPRALFALVLLVGALAAVYDWLIPGTARTLLGVATLTWVLAFGVRTERHRQRQQARGAREVPGFARITTSVGRAGGAACVRDVPVAKVVALVAQGWTADEIVQEYPQLDADDVGECLHSAAAAVAGETPMPRTSSHSVYRDL